MSGRSEEPKNGSGSGTAPFGHRPRPDTRRTKSAEKALELSFGDRRDGINKTEKSFLF